MAERLLVIGCGALAAEIAAMRRINDWQHVAVELLPAELHNRPERIAGAVRERLERVAPGTAVFVAYADCGTGGELDAVLKRFGVGRLPGAHCYELFAGGSAFARLQEREPGTFYLTDFLVRQFDRLVWRGLGIDRHPELRDAYFGNYRRLVYLAQTEDADLDASAREAADRLSLAYERIFTGIDRLAEAIPAGRAGERSWPS